METVNEVREEFVDAILDGFTVEELALYDQFFGRLFDNTRKAMERGGK